MRGLDGFSKPLQDFRVTTAFGGYLSIMSVVLMSYLFFSELRYFLRIDTKEQMVLDPKLEKGEVNLSMDLSFPALPCDALALHVFDQKKSAVLPPHKVKQKQWKTSATFNRDGSLLSSAKEGAVFTDFELDAKGCGSCYSASVEGECCATCEDVERAHKQRGLALPALETISQCRHVVAAQKALKEVEARPADSPTTEGCRLRTNLSLPKMPTKVSVGLPGWLSNEAVTQADVDALKQGRISFAHTVHQLSFGPRYPGLFAPLDGRDKTPKGQQQHKAALQEHHSAFAKALQEAGGHVDGHNHHDDTEVVGAVRFAGANGGLFDHFQYDVHAIPTEYTVLAGSTVQSYQYSVTEYGKAVEFITGSDGKTHFASDVATPGLQLSIDYAPFMVKIRETRQSLVTFLTRCCALLGGVFAFSSMLDIFAYKGSKWLLCRRSTSIDSDICTAD